jgi:hypothetical protein
MGIITKKTKIILGVILFLEIIFLIRAHIIYSFYSNDESYGDGVSDPSKYDHDFYSAISISLAIMSVLMLTCIILLKKNKKDSEKINVN